MGGGMGGGMLKLPDASKQLPYPWGGFWAKMNGVTACAEPVRVLGTEFCSEIKTV